MKNFLSFIDKIDFKFICYWLIASFFMGIVTYITKLYNMGDLHILSLVLCISLSVNLFKLSFEHIMNKNTNLHN